MKKLKTLCVEVLARSTPSAQSAVPACSPVEAPHQHHANSDEKAYDSRSRRDYLNRERVTGVQAWMSSFLPLASDMVDRPIRFKAVRDRLRLHGSVPLVRGFSEQQQPARDAAPHQHPSNIRVLHPSSSEVTASGATVKTSTSTTAAPEASYHLGWIMKEIARVPGMFYRSKHAKSVEEGRKIRKEVFPSALDTVSGDVSSKKEFNCRDLLFL